ncbi:YcaO-like family protein [Solwaraspora sp. WMMA2101]|uniref:YcaO-like family protein n=1 Tax=Solwaraspora sp. WMMA2101 TaxID=3404124 RepID=UPI003B949A78
MLVTADSKVTRHPFTPAPGATADAPATSSPPAYTVARPFGERVVRLVDPRLGIISEIREAGHRQAPIHVSEAEVRRPGHPTGTPIRLVAAGETLSEARATVARKALEWYAAHCFDERLTDGPDAARAPGIRVVTGRRLSDDNPVPLRVNEVFELTPTPSPAVPAGVGSGESWSDAVLAGLLSRVCQLATAAVGHEPVPPLALRAMTANSDIRIALTELTAAGLQADLCDLTSHSGIPTVGVVADGSLAAVASDVSLVGAVRAAVRAAVLRQQSALDTAIPAATSGVVLPVRLGAAPIRPSADVSLSGAVHALEAKGLIPVAADLDHDPAISDALPYVVRVVLHG